MIVTWRTISGRFIQSSFCHDGDRGSFPRTRDEDATTAVRLGRGVNAIDFEKE